MINTSCGLVTGLAMFPAPGLGTGTLLESFVLAALVPVGVSLLPLRLLPVREAYDFSLLGPLFAASGGEPHAGTSD